MEGSIGRLDLDAQRGDAPVVSLDAYRGGPGSFRRAHEQQQEQHVGLDITAGATEIGQVEDVSGLQATTRGLVAADVADASHPSEVHLDQSELDDLARALTAEQAARQELEREVAALKQRLAEEQAITADLRGQTLTAKRTADQAERKLSDLHGWNTAAEGALTEEISARESAEQKTLLDKLGLPNSLAGAQRFEMIYANNYRHEKPTGILFVDLKNFKALNDALGQVVGDDILRDVYAILKDCLRGDDFAFHEGGDEYAIVLSEFNGNQHAYDVVGERIRNHVLQYGQALVAEKAPQLRRQAAEVGIDTPKGQELLAFAEKLETYPFGANLGMVTTHDTEITHATDPEIANLPLFTRSMKVAERRMKSNKLEEKAHDGISYR